MLFVTVRKSYQQPSDKYNNETENNGPEDNMHVIGLMDTTALYPCLTAEKYAEIIKNE